MKVRLVVILVECSDLSTYSTLSRSVQISCILTHMKSGLVVIVKEVALAENIWFNTC